MKFINDYLVISDPLPTDEPNCESYAVRHTDIKTGCLRLYLFRDEPNVRVDYYLHVEDTEGNKDTEVKKRMTKDLAETIAHDTVNLLNFVFEDLQKQKRFRHFTLDFSLNKITCLNRAEMVFLKIDKCRKTGTQFETHVGDQVWKLMRKTKFRPDIGGDSSLTKKFSRAFNEEQKGDSHKAQQPSAKPIVQKLLQQSRIQNAQVKSNVSAQKDISDRTTGRKRTVVIRDGDDEGNSFQCKTYRLTTFVCLRMKYLQ